MTTARTPSRTARHHLGPSSVGEAIRLLRHRARLTRDALATGVGVSAGAISNYENDVSAAPAATLRRLAVVFSEALDADPSELWEQLGDILDRQSEEQRPRRASRAAKAG
jgi:transcriptional regulator with XRE-family HTH domain